MTGWFTHRPRENADTSDGASLAAYGVLKREPLTALVACDCVVDCAAAGLCSVAEAAFTT